MKSERNRYWVLGLAITLTAFALRLWGLTATSLWYDETFMLYHVQHGVTEGVLGLLREDNALPLHGVLLALWVQLVGNGEFVARYLSVLLGTVTVPLVLRLGATVSARQYGGWGPALALTTLPIYIYYAQEVRMYALAIPLSVAFAWAAAHLVMGRKTSGLFLGLGLAMLLAHLFSGLLWMALFVWGLGVLLVRGGRANGRLRQWLLVNLALGVLSFPVMAWAAWRVGTDATATSAIPITVLRWLPVQFGVGQYLPYPWTTVFVGLVIASLVSSVVGLIVSRRWQGMLWLVATLIVPVASMVGVTLVKAKWNERYLLSSFGIALVVLVGVGWEVLLGSEKRGFKWLGATLICAWLALTLPSVARQAQGTWALGIVDEWHPRPDFRGVARYIAEHDAPGDAVVVVGGYAAHTLDYYYDGPARVFGLPPNSRLLDLNHPLDLHALEDLERETRGAQRLWVVFWQVYLADPTGLISSVLVEQCHRLPVDTEFTNLGVMLFDLTGCRPLDRLTTPPYRLEVHFAQPIVLLGYDIRKVDETWEVDLWWETEGSVDSYIVFVHLMGPDGTLVVQHDHIAGADAYPSGYWVPGIRLRDRFFLHVPGGECPGCMLRVGLYNDYGRLPLATGEGAVDGELPEGVVEFAPSTVP